MDNNIFQEIDQLLSELSKMDNASMSLGTDTVTSKTKIFQLLSNFWSSERHQACLFG